MFGKSGASVAVLNLGGIANLSCIDAAGHTVGFDCGPANVLLDLWCTEHTGAAYDAAGAWSAGGRVDLPLLQALEAEPFFDRPAPKSTGRDLFDRAWLQGKLDASANAADLQARDVQATLAELTARSCAAGLQRYGHDAHELIVCGGGAFNGDLMARLAQLLAPLPVVASGERGVPPDQVEAAAFAWLARAFVHRLPGNLIGATGAAGPRVLGALYPGV